MKKIFLPALLLIALTSHAQNNHSFAVHFDLDKFNLTTDATTSLDSFITVYKPGATIKLYGHTDIMASYEYNDALSLKRTTAVKNYLVSKGFTAANIIEEKGFGKRRPLNNNHGEKEMYLNRRVEIVVDEDAVKNEEPILNNETDKSLTAKIADTATTAGTNIVLQNMSFYGGTHSIMPQSLPILMELVEIMKKNPTLVIQVEGHICCQDGDADGFDIGTRTYNLSENRAKEICKYLNKSGIDEKRLFFKGYGHQQPLTPYPEKTEEERINNRRVEIKIVRR
ncbi:OmpA family protein [Ferruginibacter lapsinanis]|uniref:OmpA family protein n=1 Tax=Ferruginibacter lapsinanis TaxID=563172 RepID=UPI001E2F5F3F|nr:OmpA family protein [Ferruginibacter lapsinanis]UEG50057.1 OmpA family protein [Ferruginibacter lapsinanis]